MASGASGTEATQRGQTVRLVLVVVIIAAFFFFELAAARRASSDALEADAYHLLMDVFALVVSLIAMRLASARPSERFTFGLRRTESVAALINGALVLGVALELVRDALEHVAHPTTPKSGIMLVVAAVALGVNVLSAWLVHGAMHHHGHAGHGHDHAHDHAEHDHAHDHAEHDHAEHDHAAHDHAHDHAEHDHAHDHAGHAHGEACDHDHAHADAHAHDEPRVAHHHGGGHLHLRGAWLHLVGDALGSMAAFAAGLAIRFGAPAVVDPLASLAVVAILLVGAYRLLRDAALVVLEAAPARLPAERVRALLLAQPDVKEVGALHIWSLGTGHDAITARVTSRARDLRLAARLGDRLRDRFGVEHVTVQVDVAEGSDG